MKPVPYNDILRREGQVYAIKDEKFWQLLDELRLQAGGRWKDIVVEARLSTRQFRRLRTPKHTTVSIAVVDKICSRLGFPHRVGDLEWYTPEQLVKMGVWKPHNISGLIEAHERRQQERMKRHRRRKAS